MKIGILGGTGNMGKGFALRWSKHHDIYLGSRSADRAKLVADECRRIAEGFYGQDISGTITGDSNSTVIKESEVVVIAVPPLHVREFVRQMREGCRPDHVVITTVVPMRKEGGFSEDL